MGAAIREFPFEGHARVASLERKKARDERDGADARASVARPGGNS